jgi:hypothetical protein
MSFSVDSDILVMVNQSRRSDPARSFVTIAKTNDRYAAKARTRKIAAHTVCPWVRFAMKKNVVPTTGAAAEMTNQPHDRRANRSVTASQSGRGNQRLMQNRLPKE